MIIGNIFDGMTGGVCVVLMAAFSYISDITTAKNRPLRTVICEISLSCATIIGSFAGGFILNAVGFAYMYLIGLICIVLAFLYGVFMISETNNVHVPESKLFDLKHFKRFAGLFTDPNISTERWLLYLNMAMFFIYFICEYGNYNVAMLRMIGYPICFGSVGIGVFNGCNEFIKVFIGFTALKILRKYVSNEGFIVIGLCFGVGCQLGYVIAWNEPSMYLGKNIIIIE